MNPVKEIGGDLVRRNHTDRPLQNNGHERQEILQLCLNQEVSNGSSGKDCVEAMTLRARVKSNRNAQIAR